jgi:hypothetical protein
VRRFNGRDIETMCKEIRIIAQSMMKDNVKIMVKINIIKCRLQKISILHRVSSKHDLSNLVGITRLHVEMKCIGSKQISEVEVHDDENVM